MLRGLSSGKGGLRHGPLRPPNFDTSRARHHATAVAVLQALLIPINPTMPPFRGAQRRGLSLMKVRADHSTHRASQRWLFVVLVLALQSKLLAAAWILPRCADKKYWIKQRLTQQMECAAHGDNGGDSSNFVWKRREDGEWTTAPLKNSDVALETWRWCADFVVPLDLCPWAAASVNTKGALRIFLAKQDEMEEAIKEAAQRLSHDVQTNSVDPNVAIAFIASSDGDWDFASFYEWFDDLEASFEDDDVTLAPFHPEWQFGDGPPELDIEKHSPYPTVTVVCTSVIDKAGPAATEQIGQHNEQVLLEMGISELRQLYKTKVFYNKDSPS
jgi:hypothetical protein